MNALVAREQLTLLRVPIAGKTNHDLWVNAEGTVAYNSKTTVKKAFGDIFTTHLALAEKKLAGGDYAAAGQHAAVARAVKPSHLDPLVIRAAAERMAGQHSQFAFTRHIASDYVTPAEFDRLVGARTAGQLLTEAHGAAVMAGIATRPSRFPIAA